MELKSLLSGERVEETKNTEDVDTPVRVELHALLHEEEVEQSTESLPTEAVVSLQKGAAISLPAGCESGFLIWCENTEETWWVPDEAALNANFIYREDLEILPVTDVYEAEAWLHERNDGLMPGKVTRKSCYVLDNPGIEKYEVYYDPNYPAQKYGKCSPQGTTVRQYTDRFKRDVAIMQLDKKYANASSKLATKLAAQKLSENQAIIISDGALISDNASCAFYYIDNQSVIKSAECCLPSNRDQGVVIAEINGAHRALQTCFSRRKTDITYYYDNLAIVTVFCGKKNQDLPEVRRYKKLCEKMDSMGYRINFVEIHPKTGEHREEENKALMFFHNSCDRECRDMADLFRKDYQAHAVAGNRDGRSYGDVTRRKYQKQ